MSGPSRSRFDVVVVGAGPAGIFAALELVRRDGLRVLVLEKGPDIARRACPARTTGVCIDCDPCGVTCGWGGAGAFSDGKLTLSTAVGGWLTEFVSDEELTGLVDHVDGIWREYGALEYRECVGDDLESKFGIPFPKGFQLKPGELVLFSWIVFKSKAHRNRVNAQVLKDPRLACSSDPKAMPFDCKRMAYGGFRVMVDLQG